MMKKLSALLLAFIMLFTLVGCNNAIIGDTLIKSTSFEGTKNSLENPLSPNDTITTTITDI